jgi:hypothetical protein
MPLTSETLIPHYLQQGLDQYLMAPGGWISGDFLSEGRQNSQVIA